MKKTKHALLLSAVSMLLCLSMLVGSTFAWFTDTASTGVNKIVAGNLDIELEYWDGDSWETVQDKTDLFKPAPDGTENPDATLWEPGHTEYAIIRIHNNGSLSLRYDFTASVYGDENGGAEKEYTSVLKNDDGTNKTFKLSQHLVFNKAENNAETPTKPANREALWLTDAAETAAKGNFVGTGEKGVLLPDESKAFTFAIYMPTSVGNEANAVTGQVPTIFLGLNVNATQNPHENDSFGNTYDNLADGTPDNPTWGTNKTDKVTVEKAAEGDTVVATADGDVKATVPAAALAEDTTEITLTVEEVAEPTTTADIVIEGAEVAYDIDISGLAAGNTTVVPVEVKLGTDANITKIYHDGVEMTAADTGAADTYKYSGDTLTLYITHCSEFVLDLNNEAKIGDKFYGTLTEAITAVKADETIVLIKDANTNARISLSKKSGITIDLNENAVISTANRALLVNMCNDVTIKNGTIKTLGNGSGGVTLHNQASSLKLENIDIYTTVPNNSVSYSMQNTSFAGYEGVYEKVSLSAKNVNIRMINAEASGYVIGILLQAPSIEDGNGKYLLNAVMYLDHCDIETKAYAVTGNGSSHGSNITIKDSTLAASNSTGIYHPEYGEIEIVNSKIAGSVCGIEMRGGNLNVTNSEIVSTSETFSAEANSSGTTIRGAAIAVSQHTTKLPMNIVVNSGTFTGVYALYEDDLQNKPESSNVSITINGGTFNGDVMSVNGKINGNNTTYPAVN